MSSTVVKQEMKTEMSQSTQLFPLLVTSEQMSLNYMKRLTAVAVSNILYLRNVFTEECYGHRKLDHLKLRILTERTETVGAKQIVNWVKGCFDAMEKKYLKQMTLGIYTDPSEPDELIEAYTFRFAYDSNQFNISVRNETNKEVLIAEQMASNELRHSTIQLMRSLIIMVQSLDKLPNECYLTMKLLYYDDITPQDYEPPGFMPSDKDSFTFRGKPISISAGEVNTPFHSLKVKIRTNQKQFEDLAPTQSPHSNQLLQLEDNCTPLEIEDSFDENNNSFQTKAKNSVNLPKNRITAEMRPSVNSLKEDNIRRVVSGISAQKGIESNVISKMKEMKVNDNSNRSLDPNKRKHDFEVTQDSVFNSMPIDKRFKASKTHKSVPIQSRR